MKTSLFFISSLCFAPIATLSFASNNSVVSKYEKDFEFKYEYIHTFSKKEFNFEHNDTLSIWNRNEIIYMDENFLIKFDSQKLLNEFYIDLYSFKASKWYIVKISYDCSTIDVTKENKEKINNDISSKLVLNWENDISRVFVLENNVPLNNAENRSRVVNDAFGSFKSSWGVWNRTTSTSKIEYFINEDIIRTTASIDLEDESYIFEEINLSNFYIFPLIEVIDTLVGNARWLQETFLINGSLINTNIDNVWEKILLPKDADSGQEWWKWFTNGNSWEVTLTKLGTTLFNISAGILISVATSNPIIGGAISAGIDIAFDAALESIYNEHNSKYNNNKNEINDFCQTVIKDGYNFKLRKPINLRRKQNKFEISSKVKYEAKATAPFGDRTKARIYAVPAIAKTKSMVRKYVQI